MCVYVYTVIMSIFAAIGLLISLVALITFINQLTIKAPVTIAVAFSAMVLSLLCLLLAALNIPTIENEAQTILSQVQFDNLLLNGLLGPLLFAGSFSLDLTSVKKHAAEITSLSAISTVVSAALVTVILYYGCQLLGIHLPLIWCFMFGALISPTDPVAVLAIFKHYNVTESLKTRISGESLFNDGVGIVLFLSGFGLLSAHSSLTAWSAIEIFLRETVCGLIYGWLLGWGIGKLGQFAPQKQPLLFLTLAAATGGFVLANYFEFSGALAMVSCGMTVRHYFKGHTTRSKIPFLSMIWNLIEDMLNAVLFLLIGFELLVINVTPARLAIMAATVIILLLIRLMSVAPVLWWFHNAREDYRKVLALFTWGGLRGGLAVALALSLPLGANRVFILSLTYAVVAFSITVQGFTLQPVVEHFKKPAD